SSSGFSALINLLVILSTRSGLLVLGPGSAKVNACCQRHSIGRLPARAIRSYAVQNSTDICRINAVIFYTHRGKMFCADPNQKWVQLYLTVLKKLEKMDHDQPVILGH
uniref:C-C motif chemokine n=1 Tax=Salarias fasciatus TaxID=181472 RepID=A0A672GWD7_SALFA